MRSTSDSTLVVMAGLPATGKSTLARRVAAELGGVVLDKDEIRAALFPAELIEFSHRQDDFCMEVLFQTAGYLIRESGVRWLFVDGRPFGRRAQLERASRAAEEIGCHMKVILCQCSDETARQRLQEAHVAANRNWELYQRLKEEFEPIEMPHAVIDTEKPIEHSVAEALAFLRLQA
jgi:adenylylsulfate kinase